jgi:predicted small integral membrane protein
MALRDWSVSRLAVIWAVWLLLLLGGLLTWAVASPEGARISISPAEATGPVRLLLAALGGLVLVLPPAVITYFWYLARLRKWSESPDPMKTHDRDRVV